MEATHLSLGYGSTAGGYARGEVRPRSKGWAALSVGLVGFAFSTWAMLNGVEPFATSFYIFAWYATLLALYGALALTGARSPKLRRPASLVTMLGWSAVVWFFFELVNFRLRNWYYVFVPADGAIRWFAIAISFATVLPAVFGAEALLDGKGVMERVRWPKLTVTPRLLRNTQIAGVLTLVLAMIWPKYCFPLVWGTMTLLLEPSVYKTDPERSLLRDLEQGRPGRLLRVLIGGAMIGFLWELFNIRARGKWIYTVPFFEDLKLFEMPLLGFFGFPPFAVDCYVIWQWLVLKGVAVPLSGKAMPASRRRRVAVTLAAVAFSLAILAGMEVRTISSVTPHLAELPGVPAAQLTRAGFNVFRLAEASPDEMAQVVGAPREDARAWIEEARLSGLRGIGSRNTRDLVSVCIRSVEDLATADPKRLAITLREVTGHEVIDARVRVWVRAAQREVFGSTKAGDIEAESIAKLHHAQGCERPNQLSTTMRPASPFSMVPMIAARGVSPARRSSRS
jgi:hypothetical protein